MPGTQPHVRRVASAIYHRPGVLARFVWALLAAMIRDMDDVARRHGARFFFYGHPSLAAVWDPYIEETVRSLGLQAGRYDRRSRETAGSRSAR